MKKLLLLICFFVLFIDHTSAQKEASYTINGKVDSIADGTVVYLAITPEMEPAVNQTTTVKNGKFKFKGKLNHPSEAILRTGEYGAGFKNWQRKIFWIDAGKMTFKARNAHFDEGILQGSVANEDAERFMQSFSEEDDLPQRSKKLLQYIKAHPDSYMAAQTVSDIKFELPLADVKSDYEALSATQKATAVGRQLQRYVSLNLGLKRGDKAPGFTLKDSAGKEVSLSDFKGKTVLLDFASSWSNYALNDRMVNAVLKDVSGRQFEVITIWVDGKDSMQKRLLGKQPAWTNLYTEGGFESDITYRYNLKPYWSQQVIVDKEGRFVMAADIELLSSTTGQGILKIKMDPKKRSEIVDLHDLLDALAASDLDATALPSSKRKVDTINRNNLTLYVDDAQSSLTPEYKKRLIEAYFQQYPKLIARYNSESPKAVTFFIDPSYTGIAEAYGSRVRFNPAWFLKNPEDLDVVTHETMHLVQGYGYNGVPFWVTEGIADYVRATEGFNNEKAGWSMPDLTPTHKYENAYRITARFFVWITQHYDKDFVKKLDDVARKQTYSNTTWKVLTGKTVDELWQEYSKDPMIK